MRANCVQRVSTHTALFCRGCYSRLLYLRLRRELTAAVRVPRDARRASGRVCLSDSVARCAHTVSAHESGPGSGTRRGVHGSARPRARRETDREKYKREIRVAGERVDRELRSSTTNKTRRVKYIYLRHFIVISLCSSDSKRRQTNDALRVARRGADAPHAP